ncbi:MAG: hypothetical protein AAFQ80_03490 [Cyanobacteria bacterium J06621_8]
MLTKSLLYGSLLTLLVACSGNQATNETSPQSTAAAEPTIIELTQVGCQFLESESQDFEYQPKSKADCEKINSETLADRESGFKPLNLEPGKYIFRVTNDNVPYELGFFLRGEGIKQVSLPKVSGGGLTEGATQDYEIELVAGNYVFSCPLNPTPDYPLVVN